jgi:conjugal transfer pilus assembly protein TraB
MVEHKTNQVKLKQHKNLIILTVIVLITVAALAYMLSNGSSNQLQTKNDNTAFVSTLNHVDPESVILEKTQKLLQQSEKKTDNLQQQINVLSDQQKLSLPDKTTEELKKKVDTLEKRLQSFQNNDANPENVTSQMGGSGAFQGNLFPAPPGSKASDGQYHSGSHIREDNLSLTPIVNEENIEPQKNPDTYVPSGTFAKAVMIGGADASAAVNSQSNPSPMLFRIIASGTLPNHRKSHLKDCVVTAAVVGDISSERGLIRLENLSCTFKNNEVVDQPVEGTIFGPEGKNGIRGNPVWRDGPVVQRAFAAGFLSGVSSGVTSSYQTNSISPQGNVQTLNPSKVFQNGLASGASKSMDKLADYEIQRAEQYHPVIQLSAGTVVDVVFLKGFYLDGRKHDDKNNSIGNYSDNVAHLFPEPSNAPALPLSPEAVQRIEARSKELGLKVTNQPTG